MPASPQPNFDKMTPENIPPPGMPIDTQEDFDFLKILELQETKTGALDVLNTAVTEAVGQNQTELFDQITLSKEQTKTLTLSPEQTEAVENLGDHAKAEAEVAQSDLRKEAKVISETLIHTPEITKRVSAPEETSISPEARTHIETFNKLSEEADETASKEAKRLGITLPDQADIDISAAVDTARILKEEQEKEDDPNHRATASDLVGPIHKTKKVSPDTIRAAAWDPKPKGQIKTPPLSPKKEDPFAVFGEVATTGKEALALTKKYVESYNSVDSTIGLKGAWDVLSDKTKEVAAIGMEQGKKWFQADLRGSYTLKVLDSARLGYHQWFVDRAAKRVGGLSAEYRGTEKELTHLDRKKALIQKEYNAAESVADSDRLFRELRLIDDQIEQKKEQRTSLHANIEKYRDTLGRQERGRNEVCEKIIASYEKVIDPYRQKRDDLLEEKKQGEAALEKRAALTEKLERKIQNIKDRGGDHDAIKRIRNKLNLVKEKIANTKRDLKRIDEGYLFGGTDISLNVGSLGGWGGLGHANKNIDFWEQYVDKYRRIAARDSHDKSPGKKERPNEDLSVKDRKTREETPTVNTRRISPETSRATETAPQDLYEEGTPLITSSQPETREVSETKKNLAERLLEKDSPFRKFAETAKLNIFTEKNERLELKSFLPYLDAIVAYETASTKKDTLRMRGAEKAIRTARTDPQIKKMRGWKHFFDLTLKAFTDSVEKNSAGKTRKLTLKQIKEISNLLERAHKIAATRIT
jgi:hypothetical protein